ncbi:hypothetical protein [Neorhizobium sp. DAR64872/K0K18]
MVDECPNRTKPKTWYGRFAHWLIIWIYVLGNRVFVSRDGL